eukprot:jgi/Chlat1/6419/Chrsp45S05920
MAAFDPLTELLPSRTWDDEDDEDEELEAAGQEATVGVKDVEQAGPPSVQWLPIDNQPAPPPPPSLLVLAFGRPGTLLLAAAVSSESLDETGGLRWRRAGHIALPGVSKVVREDVASTIYHPTCELYESRVSSSASATTSQVGDGDQLGPIMAASCQYTVPPERAAAWAEAVLQTLRPQRVLVFCALPAWRFRGQNLPEDEPAEGSGEAPAVYAVETTAHRMARGGDEAERTFSAMQFLPPGNIIDGVPSAIATQCELSSIPALACVTYHRRPEPSGAVLPSLARVADEAIAAAARKNVGACFAHAVDKAKKEGAKSKSVSDAAGMYL